jgi:hypothetical protein
MRSNPISLSAAGCARFVIAVLAALFSMALPISAASGPRGLIRHKNHVDGVYVVMLDESAFEDTLDDAIARLCARYDASPIATWSHVGYGFAAKMSGESALAMSRSPEVEFVEESYKLRIASDADNPVTEPSSGGALGKPGWTLDRISHRRPQPIINFVYGRGEYDYATDGSRVVVYVLDTGVDSRHPDFGSRVEHLRDFVAPQNNNGIDNPCRCGLTDDTCASPLNAGHGTAVASLIAGRTYGVAKNALIKDIRIADCKGGLDNIRIIQALDLAAADLAAADAATRSAGAVLNMSFEFTQTIAHATPPPAGTLSLEEQAALTAAITKVARAGIVPVFAAGNQGMDACDQFQGGLSYGSEGTTASQGLRSRAIVAAGTSPSDALYHCGVEGVDCTGSNPNDGSNLGRCVDILVPAAFVKAATILELAQNGFAERQGLTAGTSFAAPQVSGAAARLLSEDSSLIDGEKTAYNVWKRIEESATRLRPRDPNAGPGPDPTTDRLLYIGPFSLSPQPQSQAVASRGNFNLSVAAVGGGDFSCDWHEGNTYTSADPIVLHTDHPDTITHMCTYPGSAPQGTTMYWARVKKPVMVGNTSVLMSTDSRLAVITVCSDPPVIGTQPTDVKSTDTSPAVTLSVTASGSANTYQFFYGQSGDVRHAITTPQSQNQYVFTPSAEGQYWVQITSQGGCSVDSETRQITICSNPVVSTTAVALTVNASQIFRLVPAVTGRDLVYKWYRGGVGNSNTPLRGSSFLAIQPDVDTNYWVEISDGCEHVPVAISYTVTACETDLVTSLYPGFAATVPKGGRLTLSAEARVGFLTTKPALQPYDFQWRLGSDPTIVGRGRNYTFIPAGPGVTSVIVAGTRKTCAPILSSVTVTSVDCDFPVTLHVPTGSHSRTTLQRVTIEHPSGSTVKWYVLGAAPDAPPLAVGDATDLQPGPFFYYARVNGQCQAGGSPVDVVQDTDFFKIACSDCLPPRPVRGLIKVNGQASGAVSLRVGAQANLEAPSIVNGATYAWYKSASYPDDVPAFDTMPTTSDTIGGPVVYWVVTTPPGGQPSVSSPLYVSIDSGALVTVTVDPPSQQVNYESIVRFSATADPSLSVARFEWHHGPLHDGPMLGPDGPTLATVVLDDDTFWVRAYLTGGGHVDSDAKLITTLCVQPNVGAAVSPMRGHIPVGGSAILNAIGWGKGLLYTWNHGLAGQQGGIIAYGPAAMVSPQQTSDYWVDAVDGCGTEVMSQTTVRVCMPTIHQQPQSIVARPNVAAHLTMNATGVRPDNSDLSYQWQTGGNVEGFFSIAGQTSPTLDVTPVPGPAKTYRVIVNGSCEAPADDGVVSQSATITVCAYPVIESITPECHIANGQQASINMLATGTALTYQWYEGTIGDTSKPIAGATQHGLAPSPAVMTNYWARIYSQGVCSIDTATIPVYVCNPPAITTQPAAAVTINSGASATLTVAVDANPPGMTAHYQWYQGLAGDTSVPVGTDSPTLTTGALTSDTTFWVRVRRDVCTVDSAVAAITVCNLAASIDSGINIAIGQPARIWSHVSNIRPNAAMMYLWYRGNLGDRANPAGGGPTAQSIEVSPTTTTTYWLEVSDTTCVTTTNLGIVNVCIPTITSQPTGLIATGLPVDLTVAANTSGLTYQWYEGNASDTTKPAASPAGQLATYHFTPTYTANYWVRVTGSCGVYADSNVVTVTLCAPPISVQPAPRITTRGTTTSVSVTATGTNLTYQWYQGNSGVTTTPITGATSASRNVTPDYTTSYWVRITGYCGTADSNTVQVSVYPIITAQPVDVPVTKGTGASLSVTVDANPVSYQWYRGAAGDISTPICTSSATCTTPPVNADTQFWVRVTSGLASVDSTVATARVCPSPTVSVNQPSNQQSGANVTISIVNPDATHTFAWYNGTAGNTSSLISSGSTAFLVVHPTQTSNYWVREISPACTADSVTIIIPICVPALTAQPASANINQGQNATLTVAATGDPTLTYQWYTGASGNTGSPVAGATSASLTISPATTTSYWVKVTNGTGGSCSANSNAATVTVCILPTISAHPGSPIIQRGQPATLSVTASGTSLSYQWYQGAKGVTTTPVGTNSNTLTISPTNTTSYWVRISGCSTSVDSNAGQVSVTPVITAQPANVRITKNTSATFTVSTDSSPIAYQWYLGVAGDLSNPISGATGATYTTPALASDTNYWVKLTSGAGVTSSNTVTATICVGSTINVTTTQVSGANTTLSIASPVAGETYSWYQGTTGTTTAPIQLNTTATAITVAPTQTTNYWVRTFSATCSADSATAQVPICYPKVNTPTGTLGINSGQSTTLTVTATGTPALSYQWYTGASGNTASPIAGATGSSVNVSPASTTTYWVRVTSAAGTGCYADSAAVTVTVCQLPVITTQPQAQTYPNSTYSRYINVVASGSGLSYQWYEGASGVTTTPVGTNASQIAITPGVTKYYWVRVSNVCGYVDSVAALQSVSPAITNLTSDLTICNGTSTTLSVSASGTMLSYQWYQTTAGTTNDTSHPVGTTNSTTFTTPALTATAVYWVRITSGGAYTNSPNVTVTVDPGPAISGPWYSATSGTCWMVQITASGDPNAYNYQWYQGNAGDTSHPGSTAYYAIGCGGSGTKYWVRVTDPTTGCHADSGVVTIP